MAASDFDCNLKFLHVPDIAYQYALGRPGYAMGRIESCMAMEGASKTSLQLWRANLTMEQGGLAAAVFVEHADSTFHMGQYIRKEFLPYFMCYVCDTLEMAIEKSLEIQSDFAKIDPENKLIKFQIFDSVAGATEEKLLKEEVEAGAPKPGGIGKVMADFVNAMQSRIARTNTLWGVNNQARKEIPIGYASMAPKAEVDEMIAKGGKALPFHSTYQEILKRRGRLKSTSETNPDLKAVDGFSTSLFFKKNKLYVPERTVNYDVVFFKGLVFQDHTLDFLEAGRIMGVTRRPNTSKYYSKQMGMNEKDAIPAADMYRLVHSPEWLHHFQSELNIITTVDQASGTGDTPESAPPLPVEEAAPPLPPPLPPEK